MTNQPRPSSASLDLAGSLPDTQPFDSQMLRNMDTQADTQPYDPDAAAVAAVAAAATGSHHTQQESGVGSSSNLPNKPGSPKGRAPGNEESSIAMLFSTSPSSGSKPFTDSIIRDIGYTPAAAKSMKKDRASAFYMDTPLPRHRGKAYTRANHIAAILSSGGLLSSPIGGAHNGTGSDSDTGGPNLAKLFGGRSMNEGAKDGFKANDGSDGLEMTLSQIFQTTQSQAPGAGGFDSDSEDPPPIPPFGPITTQSQGRRDGPLPIFGLPNMNVGPSRSPSTSPLRRLVRPDSSPLSQVTRQAASSSPLPSQLSYPPLQHLSSPARNARAKSVDNLVPPLSQAFSKPKPQMGGKHQHPRPDRRADILADTFLSFGSVGETQVLSQAAQEKVLEEAKKFTKMRAQMLRTPSRSGARIDQKVLADEDENELLETQPYHRTVTMHPDTHLATPRPAGLESACDDTDADTTNRLGKPDAAGSGETRTDPRSEQTILPSTPADTQPYERPREDAAPAIRLNPHEVGRSSFGGRGDPDAVQVPMTSSSPEQHQSPKRAGAPLPVGVTPAPAAPSHPGHHRRRSGVENFSRSSSLPNPPLGPPSSPSSLSSPPPLPTAVPFSPGPARFESVNRRGDGRRQSNLRQIPDTVERSNRRRRRDHDYDPIQDVLATPVPVVSADQFYSHSQPGDSSTATAILIENTPVSTLRSTRGPDLEEAEMMSIMSRPMSILSTDNGAAAALEGQNVNIPQSSAATAIPLHMSAPGPPDSSLPSAKELLMTQVPKQAFRESSVDISSESEQGEEKELGGEGENSEADHYKKPSERDGSDRDQGVAATKDDNSHPFHLEDAIPSSPPVLSKANSFTCDDDSSKTVPRALASTPPAQYPPKDRAARIRRPRISLGEIALRPSPKKAVDMSVLNGFMLVSEEDRQISQFLNSVGKGRNKNLNRRGREGMDETGQDQVKMRPQQSENCGSRATSPGAHSLDLGGLKSLETTTESPSVSEVSAWMDSALLGYGRKKGMKTFRHKGATLPSVKPMGDTARTNETFSSGLSTGVATKEDRGHARDSATDSEAKKSDSSTWRKPRTLRILTATNQAVSPNIPFPDPMDTQGHSLEFLPENVTSKPSSAIDTETPLNSASAGRKRSLQLDEVSSDERIPMRNAKRRRSTRGTLEEDETEKSLKTGPASVPFKKGVQPRVIHSNKSTGPPIGNASRLDGAEPPLLETPTIKASDGLQFNFHNSDNFPARMRVFARFRSVKTAFYPATCVGRGATSGGSNLGRGAGTVPSSAHSPHPPLCLRVRFDDGSVDDVEAQHVRPLDLQNGDQVKVDLHGMRNRTYTVLRLLKQGEESAVPMVAQGVEWNTDVRGLRYVLLSLKKIESRSVPVRGRGRKRAVTRKGGANAADGTIGQGSDNEEDGETVTVPIGSVYLTSTLWPKFAARMSPLTWDCILEEGGTNEMPPDVDSGDGSAIHRFVRASATPVSHPPSVIDFPAAVAAKGAAGGGGQATHTVTYPAHLMGSTRSGRPSGSVNASFGVSTNTVSSVSAEGIFANMVIAVTHSNEAEKSRLQKLLFDNGCVLVERGFDELFSNWKETKAGATTPTSTFNHAGGKRNPKEKGHVKPSNGKGRGKLATIREVAAASSHTEPQSRSNSDSQSSNQLSNDLAPPASQSSSDLTSCLHPVVKSHAFAALISDAPCRRIKYMQALALGLPCLSTAWVKLSLQAGRALPFSNFLLPAGISSWTGGMKSLTIPPLIGPGIGTEDDGHDDPQRRSLFSLLGHRHRALAGCGVLLVRHSSSSTLTRHRIVLEGRVNELRNLTKRRQVRAAGAGPNQTREEVVEGDSGQSDGGSTEGLERRGNVGISSDDSEELSDRSTTPPSNTQNGMQWHSDEPEESQDSSSDGSDDDYEMCQPKGSKEHRPWLSSKGRGGSGDVVGVGNSFTSGASGLSGMTPTGRSFTNEAFLSSYLFLVRAMGAAKVESCHDLETASKMVIREWKKQHKRSPNNIPLHNPATTTTNKKTLVEREGDGSCGLDEVSKWDCVVVQANDISEQVQWIRLVKELAELESELERGEGDTGEEKTKRAAHGQLELAMLHDEVIVQSLIFGPRRMRMMKMVSAAAAAKEEDSNEQEGRCTSPAVMLMTEAAFYSGVKVDI